MDEKYEIAWKSLIIIFITIIYSCDNNIEKKTLIIENDSVRIKKNKNRFDSIGIIADFITNSGGKLTTKETRIIYETDTSITGNLVNLAVTLIQDGKVIEAEKFLNKALLKNRNFASEIFLYKGMVWNVLKNKDSMYYYYNKAIFLDSLNTMYLYYRSKAYVNDSLIQNAISDITKAIKIEPKNLGFRIVRGQYKLLINDFEGAVIDYREIPQSMKNNYVVHRDRALILLRLGAFEQSITHCNITIRLNPNYGNIYGIRAAAKSYLGDAKGGLEDLKKASDLGDPESIEIYNKYLEHKRTNKEI